MFQKRFFINAALTAVAISGGIMAGCNGGKTEAVAGEGTPDGKDGTTRVAIVRTETPVDGPAIEGDVIKIGLVASQNGNLIPWGIDCIRGAKLAVKKINDAGGIDGKQVLLMIEDSESKPEGGKSATEKLISEGIVALLGEVSSGITQPMSQVSFNKGIPHLAVGATKTTITDIGENVFRVCYTDDFQGPVMAKFAYDDLNLKKVAIMTDEKQPYSQYLSDMFRAFYEGLGGEIVDEVSYETGQQSFTNQLSTLKAKNPQGIFLSGYFNEVGPIVRQAGQMGFEDVAYFGGDGWDSQELIQSGGSAIIGGYFCNHYNEHEDRPIVKEFLAAWIAEHGANPGTTMGALGYDAAALMMDAISRAVTKDGPGIIEALENTVDFDGVSGSITLKGMGGNPAKQALIVEVTKDGFIPATSIQYNEIFPD